MVKLELTISEELLQKAARKYHYLDEDMEELRRVARDLEEAMGGRSGFWCKSYESGGMPWGFPLSACV